MGTVVDHMGDNLFIVWDDDDEFYELWSAGEVRYRIDRGQMRLIPPPKKRRVRLPDDQIFCKVCGKPRQLKCGCPRPGALKPEEWGQRSVPALLTRETPHDIVESSIGGNAPDMRKGAMMARKKAATVVEDELEEVVDEVDTDEPDTNGDGDMLTAKQAASMLGTDGRTLRKFLRSKHGTVGQGQRWAIDASDMDQLKADFTEWASGTRSKSKAKGEKATKAEVPEQDAVDELDADELEEIDDIEDIEDLDFGDDD